MRDAMVSRIHTEFEVIEHQDDDNGFECFVVAYEHSAASFSPHVSLARQPMVFSSERAFVIARDFHLEPPARFAIHGREKTARYLNRSFVPVHFIPLPSVLPITYCDSTGLSPYLRTSCSC